MANGKIAQEQAYWGQQASLDELKKKYAHLQPWQLEVRDPEAYKLLYEEEAPAPTGFTDKYWPADLLGNLAWAAGEELTLGATLGLDIYAGGVGREALGVDEWAENSWAGRIGGIAGQGIGFIGGLKALGLGASAVSKGLNLGSKTLARGAGNKLRSETAETLSKIVGKQDDAVMRDFAEELYQTGQRAIKTGEETAATFGRKATKVDPFETFDLAGEINKNFDDLLMENIRLNPSFGDDVVRNLLDPANAAMRKEIRDNSLGVAQRYTSKDIPRILASKGRDWGLGDHASQFAGDIAYEATLLGVHGGLRNLSEKGMSAMLGLNDENYGRRAFLSDVMHGAITGALLAPARYIPGGARVEVNLMKGLAGVRSGVLANVKQAGQATIRKITGKKATDYSPKQLQTMMRNIYYGSNKNTEFFRGIEGWTPRLVEDVGMLESAANVKVLQNAYTAMQKDISKNLIPMLTREVGRDLFESFPRYTIGSMAMNAQNWIMNWKDLTADQIITDYFVGAFYMKRGKTLEGKPPAKRFLGIKDMKGDEVAKLSNAFDIMGWDKGQLDYAGSAWDRVYEDHMMAANIIQQGNKSSPDLRNASDILEKDMVPAVEYVEMLKQPNVRSWQEQIDLEYTRRLSEANDLRKAGDEAGARRLELSANEMLAKSEVAQTLATQLNFGVVDRQIRPMSKEESFDFIDRLNDIELNGKKLTLDNVSQEIQKLRKAATSKTTAQMQLSMEDYIKNSLETLGLWDASMETEGTIRVHPSVRDLLLSKISSTEGLGEYSEAVMTLKDVLIAADKTGVIRFDERSLAWTGEGNQHFDTAKLDRLNTEYRINTERMHDLIFGSENSGWRDVVPGKRTSNAFLNDRILAGEPVWHAIETNMLHLRNDIGMQILTGKGAQGTEQVFFLNEKLNTDIFKGKRKIILKDAKDDTTIRTIADKPYLINLLNNLNVAWKLTEGAAKRGAPNEISIGQLETLHKELAREVGNLFTDNNSFNAFKNYLDNAFVDSIVGADTSYGAKRAITNLIQEGNPLAFTDPVSKRRVIASSKAIKDVILGSEYGLEMVDVDPGFASYVRSITDRYKKEIQNPTQGKGDYIEFSDDIRIDTSSPHTAKDWMQSLIGLETLLDGSKMVDLSRVVKNIHTLEAMNSSFNTAAHFEKLAGVATGRLTVEELRTAMDDLRTNTRQLAYVLTDAIQNNDFLLIREIVDNQYNIERAINRAQQFTVDGKGNIEEVSQTLHKVALTSINERNRKLALDSIESVDEFIKRQEEIVTRQDASGRPVVESQTIKESQYKSKYGIDQTSLDLIKGDLIAFSDTGHELAKAVSGFFDSFPVLKDTPQAVRNVIENLEGLGIPAEAYMRQIVKPWMDTQWTKAKALNPDLAEEAFLSDTAQLLVSSWAQKKVTMGNYENGNIRISTKSVTNWNAGFLGIMNSLNLQNKPNSIMLFGEATIGGNHVMSKISDVMIQEINSKLAVGAGIKIARAEQYSAHERGDLEAMLKDLPLTGVGADGRPTFQVFMLDEKQAIILNTNEYASIVGQWRKRQGPLFTKFSSIVGEEKAVRYLEKLKVEEFKTDQIDTQKFTTETIGGLLLLTRLMNDNAFYLHKLVNNEMSTAEIQKAMKVVKLANPRGGITLNKTTVDIMRYFTKHVMPDTPQYVDIKKHFDNQMSRPHKQMTIYDEKDPTGRGDAFFSSDAEYRAKVKQQYMDERGYSEQEATTIANTLADKLKPEAKSKVDAEVYLSLPEMTALLTSRGADANWFVWDGNRIVGFNVVLKPVVSQNIVDPTTGAISVVVDKTAYKFDPSMDAAMRDVSNVYFTDSIAFKSANKVNQSKASTDAPWVENVIPLQRTTDVTKPWKPQVALDILTQQRAGNNLMLVDIDRANMMLKSISGPHDGTLSMAFGNFTSNSAQDVMNSWIKSSPVVKDLSQHMMDLWSNPFAFKAIAEKLVAFDKERGDITASMTGLEAVLAEGGIPIYEHMRPQIERALVGNYLGGRNFVSGRISNGGYSTSTAGDGLSLPVRENGMQSRFGGSGIPYYVANKNVRDLLRHTEGTESVSLVFRLSEQQAKDLNTLFNTHPEWQAKKREFELFKAGEELIVSAGGEGQTVSGTFDGYLERIYGTNLEGSYGPGAAEAIQARVIASEVAKGMVGKHYDAIIKEALDIKHIDGNPGVETWGELVRFVDGNPLSAVEKQTNDTYFRDYTVTNGERSMARKYGYNAVRLLDDNLRTPKDGINSWVLTGIEKLLDRRKGAVSEMNSSDIINPQDADFDLDKSASFLATPAPIVREIHAASGYHEIASEQIWEKALSELKYENPQIAGYVDELRNLEAARPILVRQHSLTSLMYQYFTSLDGMAGMNYIRPGYETGIVRDKYGLATISQSTPGTNIIANLPAKRTSYEVMFRHGGEFVDAIGHMKKLIKHTIDIYGDLTKLNDRDLMDTFWFSDKVGLFKAVERDAIGGFQDKSWNASIPELKEFRTKMTEGFLKPMSSIFNLALGYETLSDGTTRNLTFYDHVSIFNRAKYRMNQTAEFNPALKPFIDEFLGFLGENPGKSGTSNHPLIDGLIKISNAHDRNYPVRIERGNELANMLNGAPMDVRSKEVQDAINTYMQNERNWVRFSSLQWEINQLEGILGDMRSRRQHETDQYKKMDARRELLVSTLGEVEIIANDRIVGKSNVRDRAGSMKKEDVLTEYAVYKMRGGDVVSVNRVRKGEAFFWNAGDVVVKNPRTFRFADPIQQKHLRTMLRAFGNVLSGVETFDVSDTRGYIRSKVEDIRQEFRDLDRQFSDAAVKNNSFYSDLYTTKLEILKTAFDEIMTTRGPQYAKQLLHTMLVPEVSQTEMSIFNYDNKNDSYFSGFRFYGNKTNEQVVVRFMVGAMDGKVPGFNEKIAKEWWSEMEQSRKISYLMTHDKSLAGDAFKIGNMNRGFQPNFNVLPTTDVKPRLLDVTVRNEQARKTIQAYLTGSYFLDPIELYRLTIGLDKTMNELPNPDIIGERVKYFWEDVGKNSKTIEVKEDLGRAVYRLSKSPLDNSMLGNREHVKRKSFSEKLWEECAGR